MRAEITKITPSNNFATLHLLFGQTSNYYKNRLYFRKDLKLNFPLAKLGFLLCVNFKFTKIRFLELSSVIVCSSLPKLYLHIGVTNLEKTKTTALQLIG